MHWRNRNTTGKLSLATIRVFQGRLPVRRDGRVAVLPRRFTALQFWRQQLTSDEARRIGMAISRIPESCRSVRVFTRAAAATLARRSALSRRA